jgi:DNA mismatch repair protein MutL
MGRINILPTHLVNKIAAGEVIERPASVVKELVENAIDAGATRIDVVIEEGGAKLISVSDNGGGMDADDIAHAFTPHATSKISSDDDLFNIHTMGFRGEALASIASIARARIITQQPGESGGWQIEVCGNELGELRPAATSPGTVVTIEDLFFNTPARRKFMRKPSTEFGHISDQLTRLALPHPQVAFTLSHNGRKSMNLPAADSTHARMADVFGPDVAADLLSIHQGGNDTLSINGFIARPSAARASSKWQFVFLNGRFIRDRLLTHAIREAYRGLLDPSRFPTVVVFLEIAPDHVDVNVHPAKIEVRFRDGQAVHSSLLATMRQTLNTADLTPGVQLADLPSDALGDRELSTDDQNRQQSLRSALADFFKSAPKPQPTLGFNPHTDSTPNAPAANPAAPAVAPFEPATPAPAPAGTPPPTPGPNASEGIFQIDNSYIVASRPEGLVIVDQHALHERILYNDLTDRLATSPLESQRLLIPPTLTVTAAEADAITRAANILARLGITVEPFGPTTVAIQQFPSLLIERKVEPTVFLRDLLDEQAHQDVHTPEAMLENVLEMMACKAAVKAGQPLSTTEMQSLLAQRDDAQRASACPHGRPTTIELSIAQLAKQFGR